MFATRPKVIMQIRSPLSHGVRSLFVAAAVLLLACSESTSPTDGNVASISAGGEHTCALRTDGAAYCWGRNNHGQLGDGTTDNRSSPVAVAGGHTFASISAGERHTCGVTTSNETWCWGDSFHGQGGVASDAEIPPTRVGTQSFTQVAAGLEHSCGIAGGTGYCWGTALMGDGNGDVTQHASPVQVSSGPWKAIDASANFSCALANAGGAYCWGVNAGGVLGIGNLETPKTSPTAVVGGRVFSTISTGTLHVCGVAQGGTFCWGGNLDGALGNGTSSNTATTTPTLVVGSNTTPYTMVSAGDAFSCAVNGDGAVDCWGRGGFGQLGNGANTMKTSPTPIASDSLFSSVSAGGVHACAVTRGHHAYCWGNNSFGQRGDGTLGGAAGFAPVKVIVP